eukprot:CAMPEP_0202765692 /NCGR_PEP_ID=MMETSP1388-20130828/28975_1 /ASSEMBLY_ACC=CAM_ASM_000864 /TAXON_ID=37098 /ORGANISM="Isochrysis sp, Strain CCMP1244" /LENGTH=74 /DNA_ID=CAMNT_0049434273 /DNA_START=76 /DNA_END=298 /DNA_ORIENTATION=+
MTRDDPRFAAVPAINGPPCSESCAFLSAPQQQTALAARAGRLPALARGVEPSRNVLNSLPVGGLPAPARRHARG